MKRVVLGFLLSSVICLSAQPPGGGSGDGIWVRNAFFGERDTFDACYGHQPGNGQYHHHVDPVCLRAQLNDNLVTVYSGRTGTTYTEKTSGLKHSPILGWALDGYPIYGPYGYSNPTDATSAVTRMRSSFQLRSITQRHTLPTWALAYHTGISQTLTTSQYGPDVSARFPLGRYLEDYDFVGGSGDLDVYNGRTTVTPEFPGGTYAYFVTIDSAGVPAFPYILSTQYYGTAINANTAVAADAQDYFNAGTTTAVSGIPVVASFFTKNYGSKAQVVSGYDPAAGAQTTWPGTLPSGANSSGTQTTPAAADPQRIRFDAADTWVNSTGLPSYTIGPWFMATSNSGVFVNFPTSQNFSLAIPRTPVVASTKTATGLGAVGMWVNGVAIFNALDGGSYSNSSGDDVGGGTVKTAVVSVSSASQEGGPVTAGALVSAYAAFGATLATSTAGATSPSWPTTLGGATVQVRDSAGTSRPAQISYASPSQVNYLVPTGTASGIATVIVSAAGTNFTGGLNVVPNYPGLFTITADKLAAGSALRVSGTQQIPEALFAINADGSLSAAPVSLGSASDQTYLVLYGTGVGTTTNPTITATINGIAATVAYAGPQGTYSGLDQINLLIPALLAGKGKVNVVVTVAGKPSNPVYVVIQ